MRPKSINKTKINDVQKRSVLGHPTRISRLGPDRLFWIYVEKNMESEVDATTHQKSMPTQVANKVIKIIKNHVALMCKNLQAHCKHMFCRLRARTEKVANKHRTLDQIHPKIDKQSMRKRCSKKWCQNDRKRCEHWAPKGARNNTYIRKIHAKINAKI